MDSVIPASPPNHLPQKLSRAPYSTSKICRTSLRAAVVFFKSSSGRYAVAEVYAGDNLYLRNLQLYNSNRSRHLTKESLAIRSSYLCNLDTGRETSSNADFWWQGVSAGVNCLAPKNNAQTCIGYNLAGLTSNSIRRMSLTITSVNSNLLDFAVIVGKTTEGRYFKLLVHAKPNNILNISYLEVYNANGSRYKYGDSISVTSLWTCTLDTMTLSGGKFADIWWHVISNNVGFLEKYSTAKMRLIWTI